MSFIPTFHDAISGRWPFNERSTMEQGRTFTAEEVVGIAFTAAGAATGPLLQDHPHYVFPSERVSERVALALRENGIEPKDFQGYGSVTPPDFEAVKDMVSVTLIEAYLDSSIRYWRAIRDGRETPTPGVVTGKPGPNIEIKDAAVFYIDAFQSARTSLLGTTLDEEPTL